MALGGKGVISVVSNILPRQTHDMAAAMLRGDYETARALQFQLAPVISLLFSEVNPIPVKAALSMMGLCENHLRLPLTPMEAAHQQALQAEMRALGLQV